jgi:hypothetical protein
MSAFEAKVLGVVVLFGSGVGLKCPLPTHLVCLFVYWFVCLFVCLLLCFVVVVVVAVVVNA